MAKINRHDRRQGRRLTPDYQASLYRDARRLREYSSASSTGNSRPASSSAGSATY